MKILNFILLLLGTFTCFAQLGNHKRIILKNGSEYKGIVVRNSNDTLQLLTSEDHLLLFTKDQVLKVEDESKASMKYILATEGQKKWYSTTNLLVDFDATDQLGVGVETFYGIRHNKHFQNGIGIGFKQDIGWYNYEPLTAHIALQTRVNLRPAGSTPFLSYEPAYLLMLNSGLRDDRYKKFGHSLELGYRFYKPRKGRSFNLSMAVLRRVGEDFERRYDPVYRVFNYTSLGWNPEYKMVLKLGWQL